MKIAIAQLNPTIGDLKGNADKILNSAQQAASQGAILVLTPELSLCGYPPRDLLMHPGFITEMAKILEQLARDLPPQLVALVGTVEVNPTAESKGGKPLYNSMALLFGGKVQEVFHKRLLPTYDVFDEDRYFEPGRQANHFTLEALSSQQLPVISHQLSVTSYQESVTSHQLSGVRSQESGVRDQEQLEIPLPLSSPSPPSPHPLIRIGITICEDLWNDEEFWGKRSYAINPIADLVQTGVDLTINLSASPYTVGKQQLREAMLQHAATRFHQPVIYVNQIGANDDLIFDGCSVAFNRNGELVCRARPFETDLVYVEYDPTTQDLLPYPPTPPPLHPPTSPPLHPPISRMPETEDAELWSALVLGVRDYAHKCGFSKAVIGLSGGVDSALVAAIATAALGPDHVLGVLMPSPYSSEHSVKDALQLASNLGFQTVTLPIGELMQSYDHTLADLFAGTEFGIAEENIQSRIRGNLLMAIANKFGHLLLSTGNKSEIAVGYCTLYGDMNGGLAAIADVPKTRVYSICHWLNQRQRATDNGQNEDASPAFCFSTSGLEVIPANILTKAPSAELKPGQFDQDSLPPYNILDDILVRLIHNHQTPDQMIAAGHDPKIVNQVIRLVSRAEFKRRQAPPVLKVTDRAFGMGWRMPIANRWLPGRE
jgi:NAD+ synthetase